MLGICKALFDTSEHWNSSFGGLIPWLFSNSNRWSVYSSITGFCTHLFHPTRCLPEGYMCVIVWRITSHKEPGWTLHKCPPTKNTRDIRAALLPAENCTNYRTPPKKAFIKSSLSRHLSDEENKFMSSSAVTSRFWIRYGKLKQHWYFWECLVIILTWASIICWLLNPTALCIIEV